MNTQVRILDNTLSADGPFLTVQLEEKPSLLIWELDYAQDYVRTCDEERRPLSVLSQGRMLRTSGFICWSVPVSDRGEALQEWSLRTRQGFIQPQLRLASSSVPLFWRWNAREAKKVELGIHCLCKTKKVPKKRHNSRHCSGKYLINGISHI